MRSALERMLVVVALALGANGAVHAQQRDCIVTHQPFVQGGVAKGQMHVTNDGRPCAFTFKFGGSFEPSDWTVDEAPKHGRVEVSGGRLTYFPTDGYAGADSFTVTVFGNNPFLAHGHKARNGRFAFDVDVRTAP